MKVNVFHVEGALPYVLSAHETTTIHFSEKRVWSLQAQIQREKNLNFFTLSIKDAVKDKNNVWLRAEFNLQMQQNSD